MKKLFVLAVLTGLAGLFIGCGDDKKESQSQNMTSTPAQVDDGKATEQGRGKRKPMKDEQGAMDMEQDSSHSHHDHSNHGEENTDSDSNTSDSNMSETENK